MPPDYIYFFIFIVIIFLWSNESRQFNPIASFISRFWPSNNQVPRQQSCHSGISGTSGLSNLVSTARRGASQDHTVGSSQGTDSESCSCTLRNLLRRCDPVTRAYGDLRSTLVSLYGSVLLTVAELKAYISRAIQCDPSCPRQNDSSRDAPDGPVNTTDNVAKDKSIGNLVPILSNAQKSGPCVFDNASWAEKKPTSVRISLEEKKAEVEATEQRSKEDSNETELPTSTSQNLEPPVEPPKELTPSCSSSCEGQENMCADGCPDADKKQTM